MKRTTQQKIVSAIAIVMVLLMVLPMIANIFVS